MPQRQRRADAQRNHDLVLAAARTVFAEQGTDAPLDEIARRAGVGNATMYRHFPDRRELIVAVYTEELAALCARGEDLLSTEPADALFTWVREFVTHVSSKQGLIRALPDDPRSELFVRWHTAMFDTASALLTRAQDAGAVRADLTPRDLLTAANGIALASQDDSQADRLLLLLRQGCG